MAFSLQFICVVIMPLATLTKASWLHGRSRLPLWGTAMLDDTELKSFSSSDAQAC